jgi:formylglycine-generating enzyme required for sulfatase activity
MNESRAPSDGSAWTTGSMPEGRGCDYRVLRGGAWVSYPENVRLAYRLEDPTGYRMSNFGFRLGRTLTP